jgi:DNA-binding CsgD family transcriptional regulator/DNA-binding MarR family transcriptional regulator
VPRRPRPRKPQEAPDPAHAQPDPIPIDRAGLVDTLADFAHSSAWESLRHFAQPASAAELASALGRTVAAVQRTLDALEQVGLVRRLAATARSRHIRYEVTRAKIVIHWDPANPAHRALHGRLGHAFERRSAAHIAAALPYDQREATRGYIDRRLFWGHFEQDDLDQLKAIVGMLDLLMARVNARHAQSGAPAAPCSYHASFAVVPIPAEFPPPALIQVDGRQNTPYAKRHRAASAFESLTAREREVFDMLLTGRSLAEIGRELGIARPTVATLAKHCYGKFGVGGRQELVAAAMGLARRGASSD